MSPGTEAEAALRLEPCTGLSGSSWLPALLRAFQSAFQREEFRAVAPGKGTVGQKDHRSPRLPAEEPQTHLPSRGGHKASQGISQMEAPALAGPQQNTFLPEEILRQAGCKQQPVRGWNTWRGARQRERIPEEGAAQGRDAAGKGTSKAGT